MKLHIVRSLVKLVPDVREQSVGYNHVYRLRMRTAIKSRGVLRSRVRYHQSRCSLGCQTRDVGLWRSS